MSDYKRIAEQKAMSGNRRFCSKWQPGGSAYLPAASDDEIALYGHSVEHGIILLDHEWGRRVNVWILRALKGA